ncbi:hypothetical protein GCM10027416_06160 [Okibacterium endophyticum]
MSGVTTQLVGDLAEGFAFEPRLVDQKLRCFPDDIPPETELADELVFSGEHVRARPSRQPGLEVGVQLPDTFS